MGDADPYPIPGLPPEVVLLFLLVGCTSLLATVLFVSSRWSRPAASFRPIVPHPDQPLSMLVYVALPAFLTFIRLITLVPGMITPLDPINSPRSARRYADAPVDLSLHEWDSPQPYGYPPHAADLTVDAAARLGRGAPQERAQAVQDLAWWTAVCPNYAPFTLPRLAAALEDPDVKVKSTAVAGLGSIGGHASPVAPDLLAARGSSVAYFDHLLDHAVHLIETTEKWPAEDVCEDMSPTELERRAAQAADEAAGTR